MTVQEKGLRILVVDDEPQIQKLLKVSLGAHGYEIEEALNGEEGVRRAAMLKPDLLIVDLGLPDMDGKQELQRFATGRWRRSLCYRRVIRNRKK